VDRAKLGSVIGLALVIGAEFTYFALVIYLVVATIQSEHLKQPTINGAVVGATGALAGIFGTAFAALLGVDVGPKVLRGEPDNLWTKFRSMFTLPNFLGLGVIIYMVAGVLLGGTYLRWEVESPGVVKAIAVAFGGYAIAYVGKAYSDWGSGG
jgi:hypothetical protein